MLWLERVVVGKVEGFGGSQYLGILRTHSKSRSVLPLRNCAGQRVILCTALKYQVGNASTRTAGDKATGVPGTLTKLI